MALRIVNPEEVSVEVVFDRAQQGIFLREYAQSFKRLDVALTAAEATYGLYKRWMSQDPWFKEQLEFIQEAISAQLKARGYQVAMEGNDPQFLLDFIERDDPNWDPKLRAIKLAREREAQLWLTEVKTKGIEVKDDPFAVSKSAPEE